MKITFAEWIAQQEYIAMCSIPHVVSPDVIRRIERLEAIIFAQAY